MSAILDSYNKTKQFNQIAGNIDKGDIDLQLKLMFEEYLETLKASNTFLLADENDSAYFTFNRFFPNEPTDLVELLDGAVDMKVINDGLLQILESKGFNIAKALQKVGENNLSKYPKTEPDMDLYPTGWTKEYKPKHDVWVIKDENGKIRKPLDFVPVDLSDCVPDSI